MPDNSLLVSTLLAPIAAQVVKVPISGWRNNRWNWHLALTSGGMPSSHTALVVSLTTSSLLNYGLYSPYVAISIAISLIVIYDAMGVRRQSGEQAIVINELIATLDAMFDKNCDVAAASKQRNKLKEVLGHKPTEVLGGIILGILTSLVVALTKTH